MELLYQMLKPDTLGFLLRQIRENEGVALEAYYDTADPPVLTIGIGHTGKGVSESPITARRAMDLLAEDLQQSAKDVDDLVPTWHELSQIRRAVLCAMALNLGRSRLGQFTNTLKAIADGNPRAVAHHMLDSVWSGDPPRGVGPRAFELASEYRLNRWMSCEARWN